jgi:hypothetical protein
VSTVDRMAVSRQVQPFSVSESSLHKTEAGFQALRSRIYWPRPMARLLWGLGITVSNRSRSVTILASLNDSVGSHPRYEPM